jgi:hypothetical protein
VAPGVRQGPEFDRWLMRAKDIALLLGILFSWTWAGYTAFRFLDRMNDRLLRVEARIADIQGDMIKK